VLEARLLGRFDIRLDGRPVEIASRPAQSLLAYLMLRAGTSHRREQLAGLFWPDVPESAARRNLRYALRRIRKALENGQPDGQSPHLAEPNYILTDDLVIAFNGDSGYSLGVAILDKKPAQECAPDDLIIAVSAYGGDLLPGFYDEWAILERGRLQIVFEQKMKRLLDCLVEGRRWADVRCLPQSGQTSRHCSRQGRPAGLQLEHRFAISVTPSQLRIAAHRNAREVLGYAPRGRAEHHLAGPGLMPGGGQSL
jgi:hypothetical protein